MFSRSLPNPPPHTHPPDPGDGVNKSNSTFSEHCHVAYQIKWKHEIQRHGSNYFARDPHPLWPYGRKVKIELFQNMVMLHVKLNGILKNINMVANIFPQTPSHPPTLGIGSIDHNSTFSEHGHVAYQIKTNHECSNMITNICLHSSQRSKFIFFRTFLCCISN